MAQRFNPITQRFELSGIDTLFQQNPANLASNLLRSGMTPQDVSLQTGLNSKDFVKENQSVANFEFGYKKVIDLVNN